MFLPIKDFTQLEQADLNIKQEQKKLFLLCYAKYYTSAL
jgi:hypothetical protein